MLMNIAIVLLFAGWPINGNPDRHVWAVDCGSYEYVYVSEVQYDLMEEIDLCQK